MLPLKAPAKKRLRPVTVACFGEALWDILPRGLFLGGAPLNAAYHLSRHGLNALPISAVGKDFLGTEALRRMHGWELDTRFIGRLAGRPTGTVRAALDRQGIPSYRIASDVAWDLIPTPPALLRRTPPAAIVYGTLALREASNRGALSRLFAAWPGARRVLDLNLRAPFDPEGAIAFALAHAQFVKLNDEELTRIVRLPTRTPDELARAARLFARRKKLSRVCVTAGARGAGMLWDGQWHWADGRRVEVRDTVGAGDAFLGSLLAGMLQAHVEPAAALRRASRVAEFVAAHDGATPAYRIGPGGLPHEGSL
ncbi:MAG: PfkB family carbohydrate kinase [Opitutaceae bacterium]